MFNATISGKLGQDPDIKTGRDDKKYATLSVAVSTRSKVDGEWTDITTWIRVSVFNARDVGTVERFAHKGSYIVASGALEVGVWTDRQGVAKPNVSLTASSVDVPRVGDSGSSRYADREPAPRSSGGGGYEGGGSDGGDGDIPFLAGGVFDPMRRVM